MRYGTSHFISESAALAYYRGQGNDVDAAYIAEKIAEGVISIGEPPLPDNAKLSIIPGEGRYQIEEFGNRIKRAYTRHYRDNGQTTAYIEWADGSRTEGPARFPSRVPIGQHMYALFARAQREGIKIEREDW